MNGKRYRTVVKNDYLQPTPIDTLQAHWKCRTVSLFHYIGQRKVITCYVPSTVIIVVFVSMWKSKII